jgi:putative oxidoreductase
MDRQQDTALLIGRLLMAALFLSAGIPKAMGGYIGFGKYLGNLGMPSPEIASMVGTAIEVLVPIAIILGVFHRTSAFLLIVFVIVATAFAHRYWEFPVEQMSNQRNHFFKNLAIIGGLLFYYVSGPGAFALGRSRQTEYA